jgi:hypothetical protein
MMDSYKYTFHHENEIALLQQMLSGQMGSTGKVNHQKEKEKLLLYRFQKQVQLPSFRSGKKKTGPFFT